MKLTWPVAGTQVFCGGDRYLYELSRLIRDMGWEVDIYYNPQKQQRNDERDHSQSYVEEVQARDGSWRATNRKQTTKQKVIVEELETSEEWYGFKAKPIHASDPDIWNQMVTQDAISVDVMIYMTMYLSYPRAHPNSLAISHGIWFDYPRYAMTSEAFSGFRHEFSEVLGGLKKIVSCDANTINFVGGLFSGRYLHKFVRIPNFVDTELYRPKKPEKHDTIRVLFPNRAEAHKGLQEFLQVAGLVHAERPQARFAIIGRASSAEGEEQMERGVNQNPKCNQFLSWGYKEPHEMPQAYHEADIICCPIVGCSGTSLSVLEAMACAKPVITTYIGGNPELVQDGYSGLVIEPSVSALQQALLYLIDNPKERDRMGRVGRLVAENGFSLTRWRKAWRQVLEGAL